MTEHRPIFSIHVPKTGGTTFAEVLSHAYGARVAFSYGRDHPRTHPRIRESGATIDQAAARALASEGVLVVHGHFTVADLVEVEPDPSRYWIWLRDPIERTIAQYQFYKQQAGGRSKLGRAVASGSVTMAGFAAHAAIRNLQTRYIGSLPIGAFGFVGITEHFSAGVEMLGLPLPGGKRILPDVDGGRPSADRATRAAIAMENIPDLALYSEATQVFLSRLKIRDEVKAPRALSALARLFGRRQKRDSLPEPDAGSADSAYDRVQFTTSLDRTVPRA